MSKKANSEYWQQVVSDQIFSELTQHEWCEQNNVNIHNFRYWKIRLSSESESSQTVDQAETKWAIITSSESDSVEKNIKSWQPDTKLAVKILSIVASIANARLLCVISAELPFRYLVRFSDRTECLSLLCRSTQHFCIRTHGSECSDYTKSRCGCTWY